MMCRHEFITATKGWMDKDKSMYPISELMKICKNCRKTVGEIDLEQQLAAAKAELEAERNNRVVTCVCCGHEYPDGTPTSQDEKLTEHIKVCDKHPMRELEQQLADAIIQIEAQAKRLEAAEAVCTAVKECLPTIHVMAEWQKVKERQ